MKMYLLPAGGGDIDCDHGLILLVRRGWLARGALGQTAEMFATPTTDMVAASCGG